SGNDEAISHMRHEIAARALKALSARLGWGMKTKLFDKRPLHFGRGDKSLNAIKNQILINHNYFHIFR
ncbi:MAG TPA: hypothetical protein DHM44_09815, partial [Flexistipes sinusarabici]|nr:hypothetical protein [Flexistipes sinusarabici]